MKKVKWTERKWFSAENRDEHALYCTFVPLTYSLPRGQQHHLPAFYWETNRGTLQERRGGATHYKRDTHTHQGTPRKRERELETLQKKRERQYHKRVTTTTKYYYYD